MSAYNDNDNGSDSECDLRDDDLDTCRDYETDEDEAKLMEPPKIDEVACDLGDTSKEAKPSELDESMLALLPPDHPLLARFQKALKEYLMRTREQLLTEIADINQRTKEKEQKHEEQGVTLYDLQQEIQRQNEQLEEFALQIDEHVTERHKEEEAVAKLKAEYEEKAELTKAQKTLYNRRMVELEHIQELEINVRKWVDDVEDEVKNAKAVVSRDAQLQKQLSEEKRRSDLLFYHLNVEVKRSERELEMVQGDVKDMEEANNVLKQSVSAANADLEILENEHKHLTQAWSEVIVAIAQRDRIFNEANESLNKEKETIKLSLSGIQAIKKQIKKESLVSERLEVFRKHLTEEMTQLRKDCKTQSDILLGLETKLMEIPTLLDKTEADLNEAKREGTELETKIRRLQWVIDKWNNKKYELEEAILKLAQDQLISDKASGYRMKLIRNAQEKRRSMELALAQAQSQLANTLLEIDRFKGSNARLNLENEQLKENLKQLEIQADDLNNEIKKIQDQTDFKTIRLEKLMKQFDEISHPKGEVEITTEVKIQQMEKSIQSIEQQTREGQEFWIMLQNHFINLSQKRNNQLNQTQMTRKQLSIIKQKSLKIDQDLENAENTSRELTREIRLYESKLELLNQKISKRRQKHQFEENECQLEHGELLEKLKTNEMNVLNVEEEINELHKEIGRYKDIVLDKHRECLSWETKYKLIEETLRWRKDESTLESELGTMRNEIHRMEIRHQQLKRTQEKLIVDLEHAVMHREQIFMVATMKTNIESQVHRLKQSNQSLEQKVISMRRKLKQTRRDLKHLAEHQIIDAQHERQQIKDDIKRLLGEMEQEAAEDKKTLEEIEQSLLKKHQNLESIVRKQSRAKAYRRLAGSSQALKPPRSASSLQAQKEKQTEINENLVEIIQTFMDEAPEKTSLFTKLLQILRD
uniref:Coiled-coil domain-containing protein 40 n=1 Tax=Glossina austeni TaxID=7395 RepID=A0A1A9V2A3_GLOAU